MPRWKTTETIPLGAAPAGAGPVLAPAGLVLAPAWPPVAPMSSLPPPVQWPTNAAPPQPAPPAAAPGWVQWAPPAAILTSTAPCSSSSAAPPPVHAVPRVPPPAAATRVALPAPAPAPAPTRPPPPPPPPLPPPPPPAPIDPVRLELAALGKALRTGTMDLTVRFGAVDGVPVGRHFSSRPELCTLGVHRHLLSEASFTAQVRARPPSCARKAPTHTTPDRSLDLATSAPDAQRPCARQPLPMRATPAVFLPLRATTTCRCACRCEPVPMRLRSLRRLTPHH
jgi:hypothetical protein